MSGTVAEVWLAGTRYRGIPLELKTQEEENEPETPTPVELEQFLEDCKSTVWFSYRRSFEPINSTKYTSDSGWGCMLRSGQMLLAHALIRHFLGPQWRFDQNNTSEESWLKYRMIMSWFIDRQAPPSAENPLSTSPSKSSLTQETSEHIPLYSPYSLANMTIKGAQFDTPIGQWHGPTTTAYVLRLLITEHAPGGMQAYISQDATIYRSEIAKLCQKSPNSDDWNGVFILLPVRLGVELNTSYLPFLVETFKFPQSLGFAGGKLGTSITSIITFGKWRTQRAVRSMYYFGADDQNGLYYLDPHKTQDSLNFADIKQLQQDDFLSYHYSQHPKRTTLDQIDPSVLFGFYCRNKEDFDDFCNRVTNLASSVTPSIFVVADKRPSYQKQSKVDPKGLNANLKWKCEDEWSNPIKATPELNAEGGNLRPLPEHFKVKELVKSFSRCGDSWGILALTRGYVVFEPFKNDIGTQKSGFENVYWWIRIPFLESCTVISNDAELEPARVSNERSRKSLEDEKLKQEPTQNPLNPQDPSFQQMTGLVMGKIIPGSDFKQILISELNSSINAIHASYLVTQEPFSALDPGIVRFLIAIEHVFLHGLKWGSFLSNPLEMTKKKVTTFWPLLERVISKDQLQTIEKFPFADSEIEKCRTWIRLSLNEGVFYNYFLSIASDPKFLANYYAPKALLLSESHFDLLKTVFFSLEKTSFKLPLTGPLSSSPVPEEKEDIPTHHLPTRIRLKAQNGPKEEYFDFEIAQDKASKVCGIISAEIEKFAVPMAK